MASRAPSRAPAALRGKTGWLVRRALDNTVHAAARVVYRVVPGANPAKHGVALERDVPYLPTGLRANLLDVYRPADPSARPRAAVLYVHGGAFAMLSKDTHRVMALSFAARGHVVFNMNYRMAPEHMYPVPLEDAVSALLWVRENAARYGADPERIVLAGESAGGNLVTTLTYLATHPRPEPVARRLFDADVRIAATVPVYGYLDFGDLRRIVEQADVTPVVRAEILSTAASYVGRPFATALERAPLASPLRLLAEPPPPGARPLPPFFIPCGTADPLLHHSERLFDLLQQRGVACELAVYPGEVHGFNALVWRPAARAKWKALHEFLAKHAPAELP